MQRMGIERLTVWRPPPFQPETNALFEELKVSDFFMSF